MNGELFCCARQQTFFQFYLSDTLHLLSIYIAEYVPLVQFMYLVFTHMPGESYHRQLRFFVAGLVLCISSAN